MWFLWAVSLVVEVRVHTGHLGGARSHVGVWPVLVGVDSLVGNELSAPWGDVVMEVVAAVRCEVS